MGSAPAWQPAAVDWCSSAGVPRAGPVSPSDDKPPARVDRTHRQTFPRALRLLRAAEFANVFQNGQRTADSRFTILFRQNGLASPRLGFAISKQRVRLAVGRNRLRRLVRESFRAQAATLPPVDLVVLARDGAKAASNRDISAGLDKLWARVGAAASPASAADKGNNDP